MTTGNDKNRYDRQIKALLNGPTGWELDAQRRREYRKAYPTATVSEIQLLILADDKAGYSPKNIGHALYIMRTSAGSRRPYPGAKDFDDAARKVAATHRANQRENEALGVGMTFCKWERPAVLFEQGTYAVLAPGAPWTEVDRNDVFGATVLSQEEWRRVFLAYAHLDLRALHAKVAAKRKQLAADLADRPDAAREAAATQRENEALGVGMKFLDWGFYVRVPAVLVDGMAFVVVVPGDPWERVDPTDARFGAAIRFRSQDEWRRDFQSYAPLDLRGLRARIAAIHREDRSSKEREAIQMATTLAWVAEEIGDREMGLWAAAMQHEVREELGALNELGRRQGKTH